MQKMYMMTQEEVTAAFNKLNYLRELALINRDAGDADASSEYCWRARGAEDMLKALGLKKEQKYGKIE